MPDARPDGNRARALLTLRRWGPSLAIFAAVQLVAALWIANEIYVSEVPEAVAHTVGGPFNLLLRLDRLWAYGGWDDVGVVLLLALVALLPWAHAWRPRRLLLPVSLLGSVLWAAAGFGFTIDHL